MKEEGGGSISPKHLNDIERDRRSLTSESLIRQFSGILNIPEDDHTHLQVGAYLGSDRPRYRTFQPYPE